MPKPRTVAFLALTTAALVLPSVGFALDIAKYNPAANDRFSVGYPKAPVPNTGAAFIAKGFDLSGIGWCAASPNQHFVMINDRQFLMATHYFPASDTVHFFSPALNAIVAYKIDPKGYIGFQDSESGQKLDFQVGTLTAPLDSAHRIAIYPFLKLAAQSEYAGLKLYQFYGHCPGGAVTSPVVGINGLNEIRRADYYNASGANQADGINDTTVFTFKQGTWAGAAWGEPGDSGAPTFAAMNGRLCLLGIHVDIEKNPNATIDIFLPAYLHVLAKAGVKFTESP